MTVPPTPLVPAATTPDVAEIVRQQLAKITNSKNWRAQMERLVRTNVTLEVERDRYKAAAEGAKVPDGGILLTKEQKAEWDAFTELKLKPADLKAIVTEHGTLKAKDAERSEEEQYGDAAEAMGWKNVAAVKRFLKREGLVLEFKEVRQKDENDKTIVVRTPFVKPKGNDKAAPLALNDYVEQEVPEFIDVFEREPEPSEESGETTERPASRRATSSVTPLDGIRVPDVPGARTPAGNAAKDAKVIEKATQDARNSNIYSL